MSFSLWHVVMPVVFVAFFSLVGAFISIVSFCAIKSALARKKFSISMSIVASIAFAAAADDFSLIARFIAAVVIGIVVSTAAIITLSQLNRAKEQIDTKNHHDTL
ncbi:MAG: hypothetical protein LBS40_02765 [Burkholderiales bacterium]|jgi:hypothetical protein|nr:hypothetical protein [Burkholderiales bacterium]